jgi:hypothetical protein
LFGICVSLALFLASDSSAWITGVYPSTSPAGRSELPALGATTVTQPVLFTAGEPDTATRLGSLDAVPAYVTRASQLAADPVPARGRTEPTLNCNS